MINNKMEYNEHSLIATHSNDYKPYKPTPEEITIWTNLRNEFIVVSCIGMIFLIIMVIIGIKIVKII